MPLEIDGPALRRIREEHILTPDQLSQKSGVAAVTISLREQSGWSRANILTIQKLAKALKVPASDFTRWVE